MSWKCEKRAFFLDTPCVISVHYRPFPHSCQQSHQLKVWVDKNQWFVWNCIHPSLDCSTPFLYVCFLEPNDVNKRERVFIVLRFPSFPFLRFPRLRPRNSCYSSYGIMCRGLSWLTEVALYFPMDKTRRLP